ncbi:hypothetical protein ACO22_07892 [Paracoccidioides brasiliensis]|uniref:N-acetyltransferase domain-containing protein n=1 Tax=Paracoccidioides brasiliensis TaxID=121759 RepID=A0A1D2J3D2_PARBR|nr:hypothetical protein ACO22_07892 [Paracoccidioides brasiliensis]
MHIRPLLAADLPDAASVVADAMLDDEFCAETEDTTIDTWICDMLLSRIPLMTLRGSLVKSKNVETRLLDMLRLERSLQNIEKKYIDTFNPDKSLDKVKLETYISATQDNFPSELFPELWYLATLAVHPDYQRRGIGKMLTSWGIEQARAENVPVGLEPSDKGLGLYEKLGFQEVRRSEWIAGKSAVVMIWEPPGLSPEESWVERARRHEEKKKNKEKIDDVF